MTKNEWLTRRMTNCLSVAEAALAKWAERYAADPLDAFQWAEQAVQAAAEKQVYTAAIEVLSGSDYDQFLLWLERTAMDKAMYLNKSSDAVSNVAKDVERTIWMQLLRDTKENQ